MLALHIAPTPFFADRGCHIRIRNEIEALRDCGVRVILCTYPLGADQEGIDIRRTARIPGYTRVDAGFSPFRFPADLLLFLLVLRTAWRERPDVLHGHLHEGALIGWAVRLCLFWRRLPVIMDMQGSLSGELVGYGTVCGTGRLVRLVRRVERCICRLPQLFFCSSPRSLDLLRRDFGVAEERLVLLNDVVPDRFFADQEQAALRQQLDLPAERTVVLYSGSLLPGKGLGHVLDAIAELQGQRPDLFFVLVGYPVDEVRTQLETRGLADSVRLVGRVAYDELPRWLAVADIALEPKEEVSGEASGKVLHYLAAGLPVVCFDTVNNRDLLGELGYYARANGPSFAAAILQAADDPAGRQARGRAGREAVQRTHSFAGIRAILHTWYERLRDRAASGG